MTIRQPGGYAGRIYLTEHKLCERCSESETRLDARFCCWCGTPFSVVVIAGFSYETVKVTTPIGGTTAEPRALPPPAPKDRDGC